MSYVIARRPDTDGANWEYWTGRTHHDGWPSVSPFRADAYHFSTYAAALECTDTHHALRESEIWHVLKMTDMNGCGHD